MNRERPHTQAVVTVDNLTDEQIIAFSEDPTVSLVDKAWCIAATRIVYGMSKRQTTERAKARVRVAAAINSRIQCRCGHSHAQHVQVAPFGCLAGMTDLTRRNGLCTCQAFEAAEKP